MSVCAWAYKQKRSKFDEIRKGRKTMIDKFASYFRGICIKEGILGYELNKCYTYKEVLSLRRGDRMIKKMVACY